jgi:hypothetical protein
MAFRDKEGIMSTHMDFCGHYNLLECWGLDMHFYGHKLQNCKVLGKNKDCNNIDVRYYCEE